MNDGRIGILIVAAYASVRAGLRALVAGAADCIVLGEANGSAELESSLSKACPDVVLFDDNEPDREHVADILAETEAGLVALGDSRTDYRLLTDGLPRGWACLLKEAEGAEILGAIRAVAVGLVAFDRSLLTPAATTERSHDERPLPSDRLPGEALTAREREVLQRMAEGLPNKTIAVRLKISPHTVKFHVASILAKLGAESRTEAVTLGARLGYVVL